MTRPGIERRIPGPLANTASTLPMGWSLEKRQLIFILTAYQPILSDFIPKS